MSDLERENDEVFVGDYIFGGFKQASESAVYFIVRRIDGQRLDDEDYEFIENIFIQMDLWEDMINLINVVYGSFSGKGQEGVINSNYRSNKYCFERGEVKNPYNRYIMKAYALRFSKEESLRRTKGRDVVDKLEIEYIRKRLMNVNKWIILNKIKNCLFPKNEANLNG